MFIKKKFALKKTRLHSDDYSIDDPTGELPWIDVKAYCEKGTVYYQISNGTIGKGARTYNMSERAMQELLASKASNWTKDGYVELEEPINNVITFPKKEEYDIDKEQLYSVD